MGHLTIPAVGDIVLSKLPELVVFLYTAHCLIYTGLRQWSFVFEPVKSRFSQQTVIKHTIRTKIMVKLNLNIGLGDRVLSMLYINSKDKFDMVLFGFSTSLILLIGNTQIINMLPYFLRLALAIMFFYSLAKFFKVYPDEDFKHLFLALKWCILIIFITSFFQNTIDLATTKTPTLFGLAVTMLFSISYTFFLISGVLKSFKNVMVQVFNVLPGLVLIWVVIGIVFGLFYLSNNEIFQLYSDKELLGLMNLSEVGMNEMFFIIYKGLIYVYKFPSKITVGQPILLIPFAQHVLGLTFHLIIISYFVSYFVSVYSRRPPHP